MFTGCGPAVVPHPYGFPDTLKQFWIGWHPDAWHGSVSTVMAHEVSGEG